ncbi:MAG TPA: hypothetical protein PKD03_11250 [Ignavibacteriaceae bacterium]|nr:hypothetical protein [Ignavibacteriaceae bacterium]
MKKSSTPFIILMAIHSIEPAGRQVRKSSRVEALVIPTPQITYLYL